MEGERMGGGGGAVGGHPHSVLCPFQVRGITQNKSTDVPFVLPIDKVARHIL